jgi:hypothetical protein
VQSRENGVARKAAPGARAAVAELDPAVAELRAYVVELTPSLAIKKTEAVLNLLRSRYSFAGARKKPRQR